MKPLSSVVERVDRENYESLRSLAKDLRRSIDLFAFDKAAGTVSNFVLLRTGRRKSLVRT